MSLRGSAPAFRLRKGKGKGTEGAEISSRIQRSQTYCQAPYDFSYLGSPEGQAPVFGVGITERLVMLGQRS